jgi:SNF2 family DNA or RNA helicase
VRARVLRDAEGSISALLCPALARVLQPRQWRGVRWLYAAAMRGGGVLGDDPGLGKTLQAIAVAEALVRGQHLLLQPPGAERLHAADGRRPPFAEPDGHD